MRENVVNAIFSIAKQPNAFELLEQKFSNINILQLCQEVVQVGIMPEMFEHDSSEEKLWSKFSDIILAECLSSLGLESRVIRTRGNSADVYSIAKDYTLVSDAKCFRLSRTAKNQKDFKVKALDDWRREDTFALLVAPLYQYPMNRSQIYPQAITKNVTLLSYTHIKVLLENYNKDRCLKPLWQIGESILIEYPKTTDQVGQLYWSKVDNIVTSLCNIKIDDLKHYRIQEIEKTRELGAEGIDYWQGKINEFNQLTREEAIKFLIKAQKIEQKIQTIEKAIQKDYYI